MKSTQKFQPTFWASLLTVVSLIILCSLGTWQIKRLSWKTGLLVQIEEQGRLPPQNYKDYLNALAADDLDALIFRKVRVEGVFDHAAAIHIYPRLYKEQQGFHVITPLKTEYGSILVNRGWVKTGADYHKTEGNIVLEGQFRKPDRKNIFTPPNDLDKNMFYWLDYQAFDIKTLPKIMIYQSPSIEAENMSEMPYAVNLPAHIPNNHLQYAFFWFAMALILVVIYILYHMKPAAQAGRDT